MAADVHKRSFAEKAFIALFLPLVTLMYLAYKYPNIFVEDPYDLYLLGKSVGFWYNFAYTFIVCYICASVVIKNTSPYKKGGKEKALSPYQRKKFISIFFVQFVLFFLLPYIIPGLKNKNGFFDDRIMIHAEQNNSSFKEGDAVYQIAKNYKRDSSGAYEVIDVTVDSFIIQAVDKDLFGHAERRVLDATLFSFQAGDKLSDNGYLYSASDTSGLKVGKVHKSEGDKFSILVDPTLNKNAYVYVYNGFTSSGGFIYIFLLIPLSVWFFGKRYCSWFCACGNLAETVGITKWGGLWVRHHTPRGETSRKLEVVQYFFLVWAFVFGMILFLDTWKLFTVGNMATAMRVYQDIVMDLIFGALIGVGAYPFFGTRIWCRYGCPLAAGMRIFGKYSKSNFQVVASNKCSGIGECSKACPMGINVEDYAHKDKKPINGSFSLDETTCVGCGGCIDICPVNALEFKPLGSASTEEVVTK
ncbi:MAG: 4Fe-4S binding protein [Lentisphaeria bacterium]|nr:4Fe-4S binding protein [Lentisphaeria bacterium]